MPQAYTYLENKMVREAWMPIEQDPMCDVEQTRRVNWKRESVTSFMNPDALGPNPLRAVNQIMHSKEVGIYRSKMKQVLICGAYNHVLKWSVRGVGVKDMVNFTSCPQMNICFYELVWFCLIDSHAHLKG
jgi:hypothetical protein